VAIRYEIDRDMCKGCGLCIVVCPKGLLKVDTEHINSKGYQPTMMTDVSQCIGCGNCGVMCPDGAIRIEKD